MADDLLQFTGMVSPVCEGTLGQAASLQKFALPGSAAEVTYGPAVEGTLHNFGGGDHREVLDSDRTSAR